jgi:hypothetical protein
VGAINAYQTGSSQYYGGGGGGAGYGTGTSTGGAGGLGGGGKGSGTTGGNNVAGTVNTGGGGGGDRYATDTVNRYGGSGVVIIRYSDLYDDAAVVGSPVKTAYTGYKVYTFNATGSIAF